VRERYTSTRTVAFIAAVLSHVPLLYILRVEPRHRAKASPTMQARFIELRVTLLPLPAIEPPSRETTATRDSTRPPERRVDQPTQSTQGEAPPIDWRASGEKSVNTAIASIIRDESYRPLGPQEKKPSYELPPAPSIFRQPKHQLGDVGEDPMGRTAVWHSEHCYTVLEEPITPRPSADIPGVNPMKCLWPRKKPRDHLFDHLRRDDP
jgi:hypothetical protein